MNEKTGPGVEPAVLAADGGNKKRSCWRRKRTWLLIIILAILVIFGVVFGAVYGTKKSNSSESERQVREGLFAAEGGTSTASNSASSSASSFATTIPSATTILSSAGGISTSSPTPTSSNAETAKPSPSPVELLYPQGQVPRDLSAVGGADGLLFWNLRDEGTLWSSANQGPWEKHSGHQFLFAPISVATGETTQTAVSVDAFSGRIVYMHFQDGRWNDWQELEFPAKFLRRPAVISRAPGKIDIFNNDSDGHVWIVSYDGSIWSTWTELGTGITSDVSATSWDENRVDVFAKNGGSVLHKHWTPESGWAAEWDDLGNPFVKYTIEGLNPSSPLVVSWRDHEGNGAIDVVINSGSTMRKLFSNGAWSDWTTVSASHEGYEFPDTQSIVRGDGVDGRPLGHLISRGTDNCIHYIPFNGTDWVRWSYLWCNDKQNHDTTDSYPTQFLPTFILDGREGKVELVARDLDSNVLWLEVHGTVDIDAQWSNDNWKNLGRPT